MKEETASSWFWNSSFSFLDLIFLLRRRSALFFENTGFTLIIYRFYTQLTDFSSCLPDLHKIKLTGFTRSYRICKPLTDFLKASGFERENWTHRIFTQLTVFALRLPYMQWAHRKWQKILIFSLFSSVFQYVFFQLFSSNLFLLLMIRFSSLILCKNKLNFTSFKAFILHRFSLIF